MTGLLVLTVWDSDASPFMASVGRDCVAANAPRTWFARGVPRADRGVRGGVRPRGVEFPRPGS